VVQISTQLLGIETQFLSASNNIDILGPTEKLVYINKNLNSEVYVSAPAGRNYLEVSQFDSADIKLEFLSYPIEFSAAFSRKHNGIEYNLSILDTYSRFGQNMLSARED
jgi:hypothetical protein